MKVKLQKIISGVFCMVFILSSMAVPGNLIADAMNLENIINTTDSGTLENGLAYEIYEDHVVITNCDTSAEGEIMIPDTIQGLPVTEIAEEAFRFCGFLTSVIVPDGVTRIGERAFYDCFALETISLPDTITSIENCAFYYCNSLQSITIPDQVTSIGEYAFYRCLALKSVILPDHITTVEESAFFDCYSLESVTIPESLTELAPLVFGGCDALTEIHVDPENQNYMDVDGILFSKDQQTLVQYPAGKSGQSYTIPKDVTVIGDGAFWGCDSLETILIPDHVTEIGFGAFYSCTSLTAIAIPENLTSISKYTFENCSSLTAITIPDSVTSIGDNTFAACTALTSIIIPENVTEIGVCAFGFCSALDTITILNPDCNIRVYEKEENNDFMDEEDHDFLWIEVENTISKTAVIYGYPGSTAQAYAEEWGNMFVALDENPDTTVSNYLKYEIHEDYVEITGCDTSAEGEIMIPDTIKGLPVTNIGMSAFEYCSSLETVIIPESVVTIGEEAFWRCSALKAVTISENVVNIELNAFFGCSALESITIQNPDCEIDDDKNTLSDTAVIYGYLGSTAQAYAEKYNREFVALDENPVNSEILWGDANDDGTVDISDVVLMNRVYVGVDQVSAQGLLNADVDQSGKIELSDSMNVLKLLVHLLESSDFPIK